MSEEYIVETSGLTKDFRGFTAVKNVDLQGASRHHPCADRPNGAGKTTCFNLITKFLQPTAGRILYKGNDITATQPHAVARMGLVRSFQISAVFPHLLGAGERAHRPATRARHRPTISGSRSAR